MSDVGLTKLEQRLVEYHNNSAASGLVGTDNKGRPITVFSTGIKIPDGPYKGKFVSVPGWVPSVDPDKPLTEQQAYEHWKSEIDQGLWPMYESSTELNERSKQIHGIMDMDGDIIKQNMESDGKQSIHVTPEEAKIVDRVEASMSPRQSGSLGNWRWADIRHMHPVAGSKATLNLGSPMGTSGMAYVDSKMKLSTDMRGNKTPEHLQRKHDDIRSYLTSEMARNAMESYRASLPRDVQDRIGGSVAVEQGRDGIYSVLVGDNDTGYSELTYGADEQSYYDALSDVKKVFKHMYDTGDARLNAGFLGRAASAELFGQRSNRELQQEMMMNYEEAKRYMPIDKSLAAEAISAADEIGDEMKRRNLRPEINGHSYTDRVMRRDARRRARFMME